MFEVGGKVEDGVEGWTLRLGHNKSDECVQYVFIFWAGFAWMRSMTTGNKHCIERGRYLQYNISASIAGT